LTFGEPRVFRAPIRRALRSSHAKARRERAPQVFIGHRGQHLVHDPERLSIHDRAAIDRQQDAEARQQDGWIPETTSHRYRAVCVVASETRSELLSGAGARGQSERLVLRAVP
jgi:hypothetical protein